MNASLVLRRKNRKRKSRKNDRYSGTWSIEHSQKAHSLKNVAKHFEPETDSTNPLRLTLVGRTVLQNVSTNVFKNSHWVPHHDVNVIRHETIQKCYKYNLATQQNLTFPIPDRWKNSSWFRWLSEAQLRNFVMCPKCGPLTKLQMNVL